MAIEQLSKDRNLQEFYLKTIEKIFQVLLKEF